MTKGQMLIGLYYFVRYTGVQANTGLFWHEDEQVGSTGFPFILPVKQWFPNFTHSRFQPLNERNCHLTLLSLFPL
jgi:hypothetical protein